MQSQELIEVAGLIASNATYLSTKQARLDKQSLVDYWVASRCRFDRWGYDLRMYGVAANQSDSRPLTPRLFRLSIEIEASEVLARTLSALGFAHDCQHTRHETSPITSNVLTAHREIARRLNELIANRDEASFREVVRFRNLRSRLQELSDQFVACFMPFAQVSPFAHDPRRIASLGTQAIGRHSHDDELADWSTLRGTVAVLRHECGEAGPNSEDNQRVAAAAMGFFDPEMFDSYGLLRTTWLRRLERVEGETNTLLDDWLKTEFELDRPTTNRMAQRFKSDF